VASKSQVTAAGRTLVRYINEGGAEPDAAVLAAYRIAREWRSEHSQPLALVTPGVRNWLSQVAPTGVVAQRLKRMPQIILKLNRFPSMRLPQMEDIAGCRAVVEHPFEIDAVAARIGAKWDVQSISDYREDGKPGTGYRALHYVVVRRGRLVEIQLRTERQHAWAEIVESTSDRLHFALKDGQGPPELFEYFRVVSDVLWAQDHRRDPGEGLRAELERARRQVRPYFTQSG
jgi:hypothetical protein